MYYCYILLSSKAHIFYFGSTKDLKLRIKQHNNGEVKSTKLHMPWKLIWYAGFLTKKEAQTFEQYLKKGSGKSFAYKRLISVALKKDFADGLHPNAIGHKKLFIKIRDFLIANKWI